MATCLAKHRDGYPIIALAKAGLFHAQQKSGTVPAGVVMCGGV